MWEQVDYSHHGEHFTVPTPHNILPKPYGKGHPPIWVACGNPPTFAQGRRARHRRDRLQLRADLQPAGPHRGVQGGASPNCTEPLGQFMNDNVMMTNARHLPRGPRARPARSRSSGCSGYLVTMVNLYHDTMPKSPDAITWPNPPIRLRDIGRRRPGGAARPADRGRLHDGAARPTRSPSSSSATGRRLRPGRVRASREDLHHDEILEMLELFGDKVIPEHDKDPVHSTDRYRATGRTEVPDVQRAAPRRRVADSNSCHRPRAHVNPRRPSWPVTHDA